MDDELSIKRAFQSRYDVLRDALAKKSFPLIGQLYTDDAVLHPHDANDIAGREKIIAYWRRFRGVELTFETSDVKVLSDEYVRELGRIRIVPTSGEENRSNVRYLSLWRKLDGGRQIETSIFNRMAPARLDARALADGPSTPAAYVPRVK